MKKNLIINILVTLIFIFTNTTFAADNAPQQLSTLLSNFQAMTANFSQTIFDAKNKPLQNSTGNMALSRPGKFRWEVKQPPQLLIADGKYLWIYDADLAQATRQRMDVNKASSPASLLSGSITDLEKRFKVSELASKSGQSFRLVPTTSGDLFRWVELNFTDGKLTQMRMADNLGSLSVFNFSQIKINPQLAGNFFQFKAPKGVDVIQN